MPDIAFDRYYRYAELTEILEALAEAHPQLLRLESIGRSFEGRDIWLMRVTAFAKGDDRSKPAVWVDGNIHAPELAGSSACLMFIQRLVEGYGQDEAITRCLDGRTYYVCPRVNPDGAEWALADTPRIIRSSTRPYPFPDEPEGGLVVEDVDGDGRILSMRVPDPGGAWKISPDEPRLMVPREPAETGGQYFRLLPEGRVEDYDGSLIPLQPKAQQLDLNRNFPAQWREEHEQPGSGEFPTSEPEVRAVASFIAAHSNVCSGIAFHGYSGVLLRPFSYQDDEEFPAEDLWTYQRIGREGTAMTGYPAASVYHEFRYHPKEVITGALDDWLYDQRGVFSWTVEIWSPHRQAGIDDYAYIDWYREHPFADDLKLLHWSDTALGGEGYVDWYPFEHPQLGPVELGGWAPLYSFWNPPPHLLEQEIARFPQWLVWHGLIAPELAVHDAKVAHLGGQAYEVTLTVRNEGWLPSYVTQRALAKRLTRGVIFEIQCAGDSRLVGGRRRQTHNQLEGRAYKPSSITGWAGLVSDPTDDRAKAQWVVEGEPGAEVTLTARHERAGRVEVTLILPAPREA